MKDIEGKITTCKFKLGNDFIQYNTKNKYHVTYLGFIRIEWRLTWTRKYT